MNLEHKNLWKKYEDNLLNEAVTQRRIKKLRNMFVTIDREINNLETANKEEIEKFITKLNRDEFTRLDKRKYSGSTKSDLKKFLRQFYKWLKGNNEYYPPEVAWIKSKISKDELPEEKDVLSFKEVVQLANSFSKIEYRLLILMLFDSGFRIGEMLSVKKKNLTWEEFTTQEKCFWIRCLESKTTPRKIPIPLFTEEINSFLNSQYYKVKSDDDLLFDMKYGSIRKALWTTSKRVIGKKISPHNLRHSSATYYSKEYDGNMMLISQRYGWDFNSKELKTYIRNSGAYQKAGAKKIYENETVDLRKKILKLEDTLSNLTAILNTIPAFKEHINTPLKDLEQEKERRKQNK